MERFNIYVRDWKDLPNFGRFNFAGLKDKEAEFQSRGMVDIEGQDRSTGIMVPLTVWKSNR